MRAIISSIKNKTKEIFKNKIARTLFYRDVLRYNFPNLLKSSVPISSEAEKCLSEFRKNGYITFIHKFEELADYIDKEYFIKYEQNQLDENLFKQKRIIDLNARDGDKYRRTGLETSLYISYRDPMFEQLLCNKDLASLLYNYFKRQPYYRNPVHLTKDSFSREIIGRTSSKYHLDGGFHQLTIILSVNDTEENDTHTKYASGSHKKYRYKSVADRDSISESWVEQNWPITRIVGKKGSVHVFDAGNGFHKLSEQLNSTRKLFFINVTCGSHIQLAVNDKLEDIAYLKDKPLLIQNMFKKVCA